MQPRHAAPSRPRKLRRYLIALVAAPLLLGGMAAGYFALNSGTGDFQVSNAGFTISLQQPTGQALAPGNGATQTIDFTVANNTNQTLTLNTETATISTNAQGMVYDTLAGAWSSACEAAWFSITWGDGGVALPTQVTAGDAMTNGEIFVTMPANASINQNACAGLSPEVSLSVS